MRGGDLGSNMPPPPPHCTPPPPVLFVRAVSCSFRWGGEEEKKKEKNQGPAQSTMIHTLFKGSTATQKHCPGKVMCNLQQPLGNWEWLVLLAFLHRPVLTDIKDQHQSISWAVRWASMTSAAGLSGQTSASWHERSTPNHLLSCSPFCICAN